MREETRKDNFFAPLTGSDLLKGRLISWFNARFFFAGTALNSKSESGVAIASIVESFLSSSKAVACWVTDEKIKLHYGMSVLS